MRLFTLAFIFFSFVAQAQSLQDTISAYSEHVHASYQETLVRAENLRTALKIFTISPSVLTQEMAKTAWKEARESYGRTEAFRFYNGPIDSDGGPEGRLNSWPLDESYIDYVVGAPTAGIINNESEFPELTKELLVALNELDGEKNIATGYHAIEFLLWGQDFFSEGAGQRSFEDFLTAPNAARRVQYLNLVADVLIDDLRWLENEWRPGASYRVQFEQLPETAAMKKILSGIIFMAGDELSGERMYVAYDTRGQEDEHSCFSDMTHMDIQWNYQGIERVILATKLLELPSIKGTAVASRLAKRMSTTSTLLASIPVPFDQAITQDKGRALILKSVEELEFLAKDLVEISVILKARVEY